MALVLLRELREARAALTDARLRGSKMVVLHELRVSALEAEAVALAKAFGVRVPAVKS